MGCLFYLGVFLCKSVNLIAFSLRSMPVWMAILFIAIGIYWPGLHGNFFFDDEPNILLSEGIRLQILTFDGLHQAWISGNSGPSGRPIAQLSFALNYFFSGFDPFAFKATNLAIHLACGAWIGLIAQLVLKAAHPTASQRHVGLAAVAVTALWLLHPIQLLPVLHVVQRMTSLSAFFLLAALWLHIWGRERADTVGLFVLLPSWLLLWPLSFLSKETGILFPLFALTWELTVHRSAQGRLDRFARVFAALAALAAVAVVAYSLSPKAAWLWAGYDMRGFSLTERLLTEGRVLWLYLGLMVLPRLEAFGLYHDDITVSVDLFTPWTTLPSLLGLMGLALLAWRLRARARAPVVTLGIVWFFVGHALESTALPLELAHEHRNYLPLFGILLVAGWGLLQALQSKGEKKTVVVALTLAALTYFPFVTALRANQFANDGRRTQIEAQYHPSSPRAQYEAGRVMAGLPEAASQNMPTYSFSRRHYELAGELDPHFKMSLLGLIALNCHAAIPAEQAWVTELSRRLRVTPFAPGDRNVLYSLKEMATAGNLCLTRSDVDGLFAAALANPGVSVGVQAMLHSWHADYLWLSEHDMAAARTALSQSLALNPGNPSNRLKWAQLLLLSGEQHNARELLLQLRGENYSAEERKTLNELLAADNMTGP